MTTIKNPGFSIHVFFPDGYSDGFRTIDKPGWTGQGVVCPRSLFPEKKNEEEFQKRGVYLLFGESNDEDSGKMKIYIGQGESVITRLNAHYAEKDFWTTLVFFVSKDTYLNTAHIEYLESRLITLAHEAKQCELDNNQSPILKLMSKADIAYADSFLSNMLQCFPLLGVRIFEKPAEKRGDREIKLLRIEAKGVTATGYELENGFVVCKDSQAVTNESASLERTKRDRAFLIANDVLREENGIYVFEQDYLLNSPSNAASIVLAASCNGLDYWKDEHGNSLKEIRKRESGAVN